MSDKYLLKRVIFLAGIVTSTLLARMIIVGGAPVISLAPASAMAGPVSIGIGQTSSGDLQEAGKGYQMKSVRYFDNNEWVVVKILPLKTNADPAMLVLKKIDGVYQTVLGPTGQVASSYLYVMPLDVGQYLAQQGFLL